MILNNAIKFHKISIKTIQFREQALLVCGPDGRSEVTPDHCHGGGIKFQIAV